MSVVGGGAACALAGGRLRRALERHQPPFSVAALAYGADRLHPLRRDENRLLVVAAAPAVLLVVGQQLGLRGAGALADARRDGTVQEGGTRIEAASGDHVRDDIARGDRHPARRRRSPSAGGGGGPTLAGARGRRAPRVGGVA